MNQALIDQYVAGRLAEKEAEDFEAYCLANPDFARQVEAEQLLKSGLAHVVRASPRDFVAPRNTAWRWPIALAASLVAACGIALYSWGPGAPRAAVLLTATAHDASGSGVLRLAMVRSADVSTPLLPPGRARVEIAALFESGVDYTVTLRPLDAPDDEPIATLEHQRTTEGAALPVLIEGDELSPGTYLLRVQRADGADEPLTFVFFKRP